MKPLPVKVISVLKACRGSYVNVVGGGLTRLMASPPPPPPPELQLLKSPPPSPSTTTVQYSKNENACQDLFFNVHQRKTLAEGEANRMYLKQLLPAAWSHNPLITLKLICNLLDRRRRGDAEGFYTAAFWLHHNHPKTLVANLLPIAGWFGYFGGMLDLVEILYRILAGQDVRRGSRYNINTSEGDWNFEEMMFSMADKVAVQRYETDPDYRFLHDRVSDLFAHCLNRDIQLLKNTFNVDDHDHESSSSKCLEITMAAQWLDDRATLLCESVARRVFQHPNPQRDVKEEAGYAYRLRERLRKEVVEPLRKASDSLIITLIDPKSNRWGYYCPECSEEACMAQVYLEDLRASAYKIENPAALLPHQIIRFANDEDLGQAAELQWNAMLGDMIKGNVSKRKKKNLNNSLAVCDVSPSRMSDELGDISVGLGLLVSELSEESAWKGKVINFSRNPSLHGIPQGDGLKAKCEFVRRMDCPDLEGEVDFQKVFDLILQVAVHGNLKPEQMINKVFVITTGDNLAYPEESDYEAIQSKFKEKGYGDVVPRVEFLDVYYLHYYFDELVKWFLDTDGVIEERSPEQIMEAVIFGLPFQSLVVVD
ncbi:PREDICTED: uncharacterized protein LOC103325396 [Prunus mume]|uniref:Uncharacterized protein LOC103325396 n=1 Tax=Prunus mume TaxID=102107 RepID=A0ABM0NJM8_PRUMU|nr:PREDICTED: uncharacterized protein LOC103325396 [Prunus mume]